MRLVHPPRRRQHHGRERTERHAVDLAALAVGDDVVERRLRWSHVAGVPARQCGGVTHRHVTRELRAANGRSEHRRFVAGRQVADHPPEGEQRLPITAQRIERDVVQRGEHAGHVAGHLGAHGAGHRDETIGPRVSRRLELGRPDHERRQLRGAPLDAQDVGELVDHRDLAGHVAGGAELVGRPLEEGGRGWPEGVTDARHQTAKEQSVRLLAPLGRESVEPCRQDVRTHLRVSLAAARPQDEGRVEPQLVRRAQPPRPVVIAATDELGSRPCHCVAAARRHPESPGRRGAKDRARSTRRRGQ